MQKTNHNKHRKKTLSAVAILLLAIIIAVVVLIPSVIAEDEPANGHSQENKLDSSTPPEEACL